MRPFSIAALRASIPLAVLGSLLASAGATSASDQIYFSATTNVTNVLVQYIKQETVRLDISSWYLSEHSISIAIANRWAAGVAVRIIGDRASIFEADPHTKAEFYWLANQGIPIRLRFNPTWFPEIDHWKAAIFVGQNAVEFGSGNFSPTQLAPYSATNYDDESELFTTDPVLVNAFRTRFDVMWNDTTVEHDSIIGGPPYLKDWNDACANEPTGGCADYHTLYPNPAPMTINTGRLEPDNPMPADLYWGQGTDFNNRLTQEIDNETSAVDLVVYRLEVDKITQALLNRYQAGVPVHVIIDPAQYTHNAWPEYWLTHANVDKLYAAGVPIRQRTHQGVTHMKTLITSSYATNASSNFGPNWQRDHDYFVSAATKRTVYQALVDRFQAMWTDTTNFAPFSPTPPAAPTLSNPASGATGVSTSVTLVWNTASWATSYDIYLGTTSANMVRVANVPAQLVQNPPASYSWDVSPTLQPATTYYWSVVSRTFATPVNPSMIASSTIQSFTTASAATPANPTPSNGATGVGPSPTLSWSGGGAGTTYNVSFGTMNPPAQVATGLGFPSYQPGTLNFATTYFWSVTSVGSGGSSTGPVWSFSTAASSGGSLPSPWQNQDVGNTGLAGSASYGGGTFAVSGAGADIWGTSDAFQYVYQPLGGDGQIVARVTGVQNTSTYAKAGVMLRETTGAGAVDVILDLRPGGSIEFMTRATTGGATSFIAGSTELPPAWLKLTRSGSTITGSVSADSVNWTSVGTATASMAANALIGLAVTSHDTAQLNASTFDNVTVGALTAPQPPATPASPSPASGAASVSTTTTLAWSSTGATSYDVQFGTTNPPPQVTTGQASASYTPRALTSGTTYFWEIVAHNSNGTSSGPIWSFTTATAALGTPGSPNPASGATGVSTTPTLTWSAANATSYDVLFGTANPPPQVTAGQASASYTPATLAGGTTYFWQIVAHSASGGASGPVWSFSTAMAASDIVIYASDIPASAVHGAWSAVSDPASPNGIKLSTPPSALSHTSAPLASPVDYVDVTFTANAGTPYTLWLRLEAFNSSKWSDSVWVQFSDAQVNSAFIYPVNTTSALLVNMATDGTGSSDFNWGWINGCYWLTQPATVTFPTGGTHTLRVQIREAGVMFDQIVLSPTNYLNGAPGGRTNDTTIVPKP